MSSRSVSEGEVFDSDHEKATTARPTVIRTSVNRKLREALSPSPEPAPYSRSGSYTPRDRSRSPYRADRAPRGEKRRRDDEHHYGVARHDSRRHRVRYEDAQDSRYDDADRCARDQRHRYDDRDGQRYKRPRTRSRSPGHPDRRGRDHRDDGQGRGLRLREERPSHDSNGRHGMNRHEQSVSERDAFHPQDHTSRRQAEQLSAREQQANGHVNGDGKKPRFAEHDSTGRLVPSAEAPEDVAPVVDEAEAIEDRRRRREAIKAKYKGQAATPLLVQALQSGNASASGSLQAGSATPRSEASTSPGPPSPRTPLPDSALNSPPSFVIADDAELANANATVSTTSGADEPSAADYDPTMDMQEDRYRNEMRRNGEDAPAPSQSEDLPEAPVDDVSDTAATTAGGEMPPKPKASDDMFASDEEDDMFAPAPAKPAASEQGRAAAAPKAKELDQSLLDDWDDHEGYYRIILGELLDGRYHIQANLGKGMFSSVVRAMDGTTNELKAIKVIRNNETMMKAGTKEMEILQRLAEADPGDRKHLVRLERSFVHKGHLCMVFEHLSINLREVLKKFGRDVGINLKAVRSYAQQMFLGLALLRKCNILHADLKPDNILVNEGRNLLKICDLGSAADASENDITPYLVSRFYRAPEIILGIPYDFAIDMWSVGCTLFELYTGKILFTGRTNNQMLRSMMECRGKFSLKMLKKAEFGAVHFDDHNLNFRSMERDKITGKDVTRLINFIKPTRDLKSRLLATSGSGGGKVLSESELKDVNLFADLLDRCLALNPEKRITPTEALKHPFITRGLIK